MLDASCRLFVILPNALLLLSIAVAQDGDAVDVHDPCVIKEGQTYCSQRAVVCRCDEAGT